MQLLRNLFDFHEERLRFMKQPARRIQRTSCPLSGIPNNMKAVRVRDVQATQGDGVSAVVTLQEPMLCYNCAGKCAEDGHCAEVDTIVWSIGHN